MGLLFTQHSKESPNQHQHKSKRLNNNHYPAKSAFNYYINDKITDCLGGTVNIESTRENFYMELFQHTSLPRNHSFAPIIREINQTIERYTQQQFPITYANKDKGKIQTPAAIPKEIQLSSWKKHRVESPTTPSYHYIPRNAINILSADTSTLNFQSKQQKEDLLRPYREEEEGSEDQGFIYQNPISENSEFEILNFQIPINPNLENLENTTPNIQTPQNPKQINQNNLPLNIPHQPNQPSLQQSAQQPLQLLSQQLQQPVQQQMTYALIAKLKKFTSNEDDAQTWINNVVKAIDTADAWYQSLVTPPQTFQQFKTEFLRYFSNNNNINRLANIFNIIEQRDIKAVTTYLEHFHKNLRQIQVIEANYFTAPQILNQFIRELHSSILQQVRPMHPADLPTVVTHARDFEAAELEANHTQAVNLVMNGSSELDSKLKQFSDSINQKLEGYLADNCAIYQLPQQCSNPENYNCSQNQISTKLGTISTRLPVSDAANVSNAYTSISNSDLSTAATSNISTTTTNHLLIPTNSNTIPEPSSNNIRQLSIQSHSKLEISNGCLSTSPQFIKPTIRITSTEFGYQSCPKPKFTTLFKSPDYSKRCHIQQTGIQLAITYQYNSTTIFPFEFEETTPVLLFSKAALEEKPITVMYTDARVNGHLIKLILDSESAGSIITRQLMDQLADRATKTPIGKIDDFPFEVNGIITPIKVLVMEATQYQAFVGNDWLSKVNATLNWNTQEFQLTYQGQHICVPAMCGHFKTLLREKLLIELEKTKKNLSEKLTKSLGPTLITTNYHLYYHGMTKEKRKRKKNLPEEQIRDLEMITAKVNQPQNGLGKRKEKGRNKKKSQHNLSLLHMFHILHNFRPPIIDLNSNASLAARNCR
ncbi:hypothetical protein G9A89_006632 [Geosiphon pyriformis]|nr:hypothetical protein G9A89_006632 [Geosiphon pyriformis]